MAKEQNGLVPTKSVFTTGEAARICNLSQQTIIRCFDNGRIRGYRVPGSRFRRIPRDALIEFMKRNGIPLHELNQGKTRVLVVDDDAGIVEMLVDLLGHDGRFQVETAATGFEAGRKTASFHPDVLVLDYMLPDINGNEVCRSIRSDETLSDVRIIIVSGVVAPEDVAKLYTDGADRFIQKPFRIAELLETISELAQLQPHGR